MKLFVKSYFSALLVLLLAMGVYRLLVVPRLEPAQQAQVAIPTYKRVLGGDRWWQSLFPAGAWQVDNPTIVQNGRGVLLANSWEQVGPKTWKLQPLSMILPQSSPELGGGPTQPDFGEQDVWIVSAAQGAVIHFDEPFDLRSGHVPSIERGQLDGTISITRRSVSETDRQPWSLETSDLSIDRRRISTQQPVTLQWGDSIIRGRDLRLMLRRDVFSPGSDDDASPWGPLDELELYNVEKINIALPDGGLWAGVDESLLSTTASVRELPARLEAFCGGRFAFDFKSSTATLTNGVRMLHRLGQLAPDEFLSHKVTIQVEPPAAHEAGPRNLAMGGIKIKQFTALGIDSLQDFVGEKLVELKAPTLGAAAKAKRLQVNLDQQRIELAGKLDQPGATQSIAWLQYQGYEFRSPAIEYQAGPTGPDGQAVHAGWMFAEGPGEVNTEASTQLGESQLRWQRSLKMTPTEQADEQWVELLGNTLVESKSQGFMTAERIQVWLKHVAASSLPAEASLADNYRPDRLLATGETTLTAANLKAHVGTLRLKMVYAPATDPGATSEPQGIQLSDSAGNPMFQFVGPPTASTAAASDQPTASPALSPTPSNELTSSPVVIRGQSLSTTVVAAGPQHWVDDLTIDGPLTIESQPTTPTALPWHIEGQQLRLATNPQGEVDMQIDGQPARVVVAEGALVGPTIRFDQRHNLVWMDQPGEFVIPTSALSRGDGGLSSLQWVKPPRCQWSGRLLFDGAFTRIEGDIVLDGVIRKPDQLWMLQGFCQRLDLAMSEPIDMRKPSTTDASQPTASIERIILQDNVDLRMAQLDLAGNRKSLERIVVPVLTFHVAEQRLVGSGPGWLHSKFLSQGKLGKLASSQSTAPELQGAHLSFRDSLVGFLDRNEVVFDGKVELASGPLRDWNDTIDVATMTRLQPGQMLLNCDQLKAYDTSGLSSTVMAGGDSNAQALELQATGNVVFEGRSDKGNYAGNGYQVTYVQAKDQLFLRGDGRNPAVLRQLPLDPLTESTSTAYVNSATINVNTLAIEDLQLSQLHLQLPQAGASSNPAAPTLPSSLPPSPRAGVTNFFQPRN